MPTALDYIINANQGIESRLAADSKASAAQRLGIQEILGQSKIQNDKDRAAAILQGLKDRSASGRTAVDKMGLVSPTFSQETGAPVTPQEALARIVAEAGQQVGLGNAKTRAEIAHQRSSAGQSLPPGALVDTSKNEPYLLQGEHPLTAAAKVKETIDTGEKREKYDLNSPGGPEKVTKNTGTSTTTQKPSTSGKQVASPNVVVGKLRGLYPKMSPDDIKSRLRLDTQEGVYVFRDPKDEVERNVRFK